MKRSRLCAAAAVAMIQIGCHPAQPSAPSVSVKAARAIRPAQDALSPTPSGERFPSLEEAFRLVRIEPDRTDAVISPTPPKPELIVPVQGGFALLISRGPSSCHGCEAALSIAYFNRTNRGWSVRHVWQDILLGGSWGEFDGIEVVRREPSPLIEIDWKDMFGGCLFVGGGFVELGPAGPVVRVRMAPLASDNSGTTENPAQLVSYDSEVTPLQSRPGVNIHYRGHLERGRPVDVAVVYSGHGKVWRPQPRLFRHGCDEGWKYAEPQR